MSAEPHGPGGGDGSRDPLARMRDLRDRGKEPNSANVLNAWVGQAQAATGLEAERLSWLIASTVAIAVLQRAVLEDGRARFLLKGGTYLQYRLNWAGRPTKDVDGLVRGDIDEFVTTLDAQLRKAWGPLTLQRTEVEVINTPGKVMKPRRFYVLMKIKGVTWRRIKVEISPDEGGAGDEHDLLEPPDLKHFGLPTPAQMFGIAMRFQIAQKIHACSDPHSPPEHKNDRARDAVDLLLLKDLMATSGTPTLAEVMDACVAVFEARAQEAEATDRTIRAWPATVVAHPHWEIDYATAATKAGVATGLTDAVAELNDWIATLAAS